MDFSGFDGAFDFRPRGTVKGIVFSNGRKRSLHPRDFVLAAWGTPPLFGESALLSVVEVCWGADAVMDNV